MIQRLFDKSFESEPHLKVNFDTAQTYLGNLKSLVVLNGLDLPDSSVSRIADLFTRGSVLFESDQMIDSDTAQEIKLGSLPRSEAMELLAAKAGVKQDENTRLLLDSICSLLADVPLAIVITARAICENSIPLKSARNMLVLVQTQSNVTHQRGIERAYGLAQSKLSGLEQQWLAAAVFAPGISVDPQYLHQMADDTVTAEQAQKRLQAMGLLTANSPRLRIDPGLRDLARSGVDEASFQEEFLSYLKTMLRTHSLDWSYCADELGNILGMIDWAAKQQHWNDVIVLGRGIDSYLTLHGLWEAWRRVLDNVLQSARQLGDRLNQAWALHQIGTHSLGIGQSGQAIDFLRQALDLRRQLGDVIGMAHTKHNLDLLIPPAPSNNGNGQPPDTPFSPARTLKLLVKTTIIAVVLAAAGYLAVSALYSLIAAQPVPTSVVMIPNSGKTENATAIPTVISTKIPTPTPTRTPTETPISLDDITYGPDPEDFPLGINPLTGMQACDLSLLKLPAVLVSITNFPPSAGPQAGLSFSPIIFEIFIYEGTTRLLAVFYGECPQSTLPAASEVLTNQIGPIRSGRLPYVYIRDFFQWSCLVHASATEELRDLLRGCRIVYGRDVGDINSAFLDVTAMQEIAQANVRPNEPFNYTGNLFSNAPPSGGEPAALLNIYYSYLNQAQWTYEQLSGKYMRSENYPATPEQLTPASDRLTGQQLAFSNVIVMFAEHTVVKPTIIDIDMSMGTSGYAYLFRDGQGFRIRRTTVGGEYEKKTGLRRPIRFIDEAENPVALKPGNTWVHVMTPYSSVKEQSPDEWLARFLAPAGAK